MVHHLTHARVLLALIVVVVPLGTPGVTQPVSATMQQVSRDDYLQQFIAYYAFESPQHDGGIVSIAETTDVRTFNPLLAADSTSQEVKDLLFEHLVGMSPIDGTPIPQLADSWEVSADGRTYTFHLNQAAARLTVQAAQLPAQRFRRLLLESALRLGRPARVVTLSDERHGAEGVSSRVVRPR